MIIGSVIFVVISSIVAFLVIVLILVSALLYARAKLTAVGTVKISINDEMEVIVHPGSSLLTTLSENGVFLPSACGGGGTCAQCRCQVPDGGGSILATETDHFTRKEQHEHWRLGCQVKVRQDMKIKIPEHILGVKKWECEVVSNNNVATYIKEFVVKLPEGENLNFKSGGYIQIDVPEITVDFKDMNIGDEYRPEWEKYGMFKLQMKNPEPTFRAYSMANHPAEGNIVMLNIRIATPPFDRVNGGFQKINPGICSSFLFSRKPGDKVTISGPFGEFFLKDNHNEMMFIGGGAGMAPMRSHLFHLFHTVKETKKKVTFWYGARSWSEVFYYEEFMHIQNRFPNFSFHLALSDPQPGDNWTGAKGFIHQVIFDQYLDKHEEPEEIDYYLCGPPMMNIAVNKMLYDLGVPNENVLFDDFGG
jgi:Na+-transporting NADH:ubiquinone oxidoreductase subunit F